MIKTYFVTIKDEIHKTYKVKAKSIFEAESFATDYTKDENYCEFVGATVHPNTQIHVLEVE